MIRKLQPDIIIDNRLRASGDGSGSTKSEVPTIYAGGIISPEQIIPPASIVDGIGNKLPWEACITLNDHWEYYSEDGNYKSSKQIVRTLVEC